MAGLNSSGPIFGICNASLQDDRLNAHIPARMATTHELLDAIDEQLRFPGYLLMCSPEMPSL